MVEGRDGHHNSKSFYPPWIIYEPIASALEILNDVVPPHLTTTRRIGAVPIFQELHTENPPQ